MIERHTGEGMSEAEGDPRIYLAAERTFLAWLRTAIALMAFGFVIARFGFFMRTLAGVQLSGHERGPGVSVAAGLSLIAIGVLVCVVAALRYRRYIVAIDRGEFRTAFGSTFAFAVTGLLAVVGVGMAVFLGFL
jgi:putative membrane protein